MDFTATDYRYMARALRLAKRGLYTVHPNPRVGCVIVHEKRIVGEGWHLRAGEAHAEINALAQAGLAAKGACVYITLEPCCHYGRTAPCVDALVEAKVSRVVVAMKDPNPKVAGQGFARLAAAKIECTSGLLADQAADLNPGFIKRFEKGHPYVRCKLAMTLDGRTATASGESQWLTGTLSRWDVQRLRARSSAVLTGIGTVLADDPSLTLRDYDKWAEKQPQEGLAVPDEQPLRVVLDSQLRMSPKARMLTLPGKTWIFTTSPDLARQHALTQAGARVIVSSDDGGRVKLTAMMDYLAQHEINEIILESGPILSGAMVEQGLVDELIFYMAPQLLGDSGRGLFRLPAVQHLKDRVNLDIVDITPIGQDWRIRAKLTPCSRA